jgi:general secretion pathway protein D
MNRIPRNVFLLAVLAGLLSACQQIEPALDALRGSPPQATLIGPVAALPAEQPGGETATRWQISGAIDVTRKIEPARETQRFKGTDRLIGAPAPGAATETAEDTGQGNGKYALNFSNADIREVIKIVLGDILKLNYVIDAAVQGTLTIRTSRPVARADVLPLMEKILGLSGSALVPNGGLYQIVPVQRASRRRAAMQIAAASIARKPGYVVQIVPLDYIGVSAMKKILDEVTRSANTVTVDKTRNLLIVAGSRIEVDQLLETVALFDVDWLSGMSFALVPLRYADAKTIKEEMAEVFGDDKTGPLADLVRFVTIERINAILVIAKRADYIDKAETWIRRLDQEGDRVGKRLFVYRVQAGKATEIADILNQLFETSARPARRAAATRPGLRPTTVAGRNTTTRPGGAKDARRTTRSTTVAARAALAPAIQSLADIRVIADEANNALLVMATADEFRMIEAALRELDVVPLQVLIEATIAEVSLNDTLRYGIQWFFKAGASEFTLSRTNSNSATPQLPGFSYFVASGMDFRAVLDALSEITNINVISSPELMVLDQRTARLQIGDQVPVATQSLVERSDPAAPIANTIEFRDTGVILSVTPRVSSGGLVIVDIEQEVSSVVATTTSGIDSPTIRQRKIESSVAVQSGQTIVLGGLIRDDKTNVRNGIPLLSELPLIGPLFGSTRKERRRTELLVLITPRVIRNADEARRITDALRRQLHSVFQSGGMKDPGAKKPGG